MRPPEHTRLSDARTRLALLIGGAIVPTGLAGCADENGTDDDPADDDIGY